MQVWWVTWLIHGIVLFQYQKNYFFTGSVPNKYWKPTLVYLYSTSTAPRISNGWVSSIPAWVYVKTRIDFDSISVVTLVTVKIILIHTFLTRLNTNQCRLTHLHSTIFLLITNLLDYSILGITTFLWELGLNYQFNWIL